MRNSSGMQNRVSRICSTQFKPESSPVPPRNGWNSSEETKRELEARIAEEKLAKPKIKEEFIAQNRDGKIHALQISTESSIRAAQERSKQEVTGKLKGRCLCKD